jgi:hypothetical protein
MWFKVFRRYFVIIKKRRKKMTKVDLFMQGLEEFRFTDESGDQLAYVDHDGMLVLEEERVFREDAIALANWIKDLYEEKPVKAKGKK